MKSTGMEQIPLSAFNLSSLIFPLLLGIICTECWIYPS